MKNTKQKTLFGDTGCITHCPSLAEAKGNLPSGIYHWGKKCIHTHTLAYRGIVHILSKDSVQIKA